MTTRAQNNEIIIEISDDESRLERSDGLDADEVLLAGVHTFRRGGFLSRHGIDPEQMPRPIKVRVTLDLDLDVVTYYRQRAAQPYQGSYQNEINATLRKMMEQSHQDESMPVLNQQALY